jgi:molybdate transport system substrate-binding protein
MRACLALLVGIVIAAGESVTVFAAASLTTGLTEIATAYQQATGVRIITSFAASSTLAKQIEHGAPADLFISADLSWMEYLIARQQIEVASRIDLLGNALVVIAPAGKVFAMKTEPGFDLASAFAGRFAIADPASVPAGVYGKAAFTKLGWWAAIEPRLAPAQDVRASLRLVETGECDAGLVYATDAAGSAKVAVVATIPANLHPPVRYPFALTTNAKPAARAFLAHLGGPAAAAVFRRLGFTVLPR